MSFLQKTATEFLNRYGRDLHQRTFVFPTRRACLYFQRNLQKCNDPGTVIWAPPVFSIDDFLAGLSPLAVPDQLDLIFELFRIYERKAGTYTKKFKDFYPWGKMILSDFNEIDKYLVDTGELFRNLKAFKEVEDINRTEKADIYNRYTGFWEELGILYRDFNQFLRSGGKAYQGMVYREVAENIETVARERIHNDIIFCGFNALSKSEETILRHLVDTGQAEIFWDLDCYYLDDADQEAGYFGRRNLETFKSAEAGEPQWVEDQLGREKTINLIGVQSRVSQAKVLGIQLQELMKKLSERRVEEGAVDENPERVAVVLPDETLLFPVLNSLPAEVEKINISIGFPLQQTPVFSLLDSIIDMQERVVEEMQTSSGQEFQGFYYRDVRKILNHPYIKPVAENPISDFMETLRKDNSVYVPAQYITEQVFGENVTTDKPVQEEQEPDGEIPLEMQGIVSSIFQVRSDPGELIDYFLELLDLIRRFFTDVRPDIFSVDYEYIYHFYTLMTRLKDSVKSTGLDLGSIATFKQLFSDIVLNSRIPFTGEPLEGLQILGMLETQTLDFDNLFILSLNEGHLPPGKGHQSFIPFDVRGMIGLPTYKEQDAVAAYHFYRLLQRCENITLIYTTETRGIEKSEKSRFIEQLLIEYADRNPNAHISHRVIDFPFETQTVKPVSVKKDDAIMSVLAEKSYSASSLLTYLSCSLKFYLTYVLRLFEEDDISESPDFKLIGHIIHETLQKLYEPYRETDIPVGVSELEKIEGRMEAYLREVYLAKLKKGDLDTGKNRIVFEVMKRFLEGFFEKEKRDSGFRVLMLEGKIAGVEIGFSVGDTEYVARLEGTIDRLDVDENNIFRIIDYKTGKVNSLNLKQLEELEGDGAVKRKEVFQLLLYRYLLKRDAKFQGQYRLGIYPFKKMYDELKYVNVAKSDIVDDVLLEGFENQLRGIFRELFDQRMDFVQTEDESVCRNCPYVNICGRDTPEYYA